MLIKMYLYSEKQDQILEQILSTSHIQLHYSMPDSSLIPCLTGLWGAVELWSFHNIFSLLLFLLSLLQHGFCPQTAAFQCKPVPIWSLQGLQATSAPAYGAPPSPLSSHTLAFAGLFLTFFPHTSHFFMVFLNIFPQMYHHSGWGAQLSPEVCPCWS